MEIKKCVDLECLVQNPAARLSGGLKSKNAINHVGSCGAVYGSNQMPCYSPLSAVRSLHQGADGKYSINFNASDGVPIQLPCGQCIGCRLERSRQWAVRCMHEAQLHEDNCFITLTYDDEHLPDDESLNKADFQKFMKRLRKNTGKKLRYYHCGEYGDRTDRPHYHACLFGYEFLDKIPHSQNANGDTVYTSSMLESIWGNGFCTIGELTFQTAAYTARYIMKKVNGDQAEDHYKRVNTDTGEIYSIQPEYTTMSRRPGVGAGWYHAYKDDLYPDDTVIVNGKRCRIPKFYDGMYEIENPNEFTEIKIQRLKEAEKWKDDNTPDRLLVKKTVKESQIKQLKRKL